MEPTPPKENRGCWWDSRTIVSFCSMAIGLALLVAGGIMLFALISAAVGGDLNDPSSGFDLTGWLWALAIGIVLAGIGTWSLSAGISSLRA